MQPLNVLIKPVSSACNLNCSYCFYADLSRKRETAAACPGNKEKEGFSMQPLNVLIKPVSSACNLNCSYCFYADLSRKRETASYGVMSLETLEQTVKRIFEYAESECTIAWQGGEPTLAGLSFFRAYLALEKKYNTRNVRVTRCLQTNGYHLDEEWASFLAENEFLTGLSLDGTRALHDTFRRTPEGGETFSSILETARLFDRFGVAYNLLTVVNRQTAASAEEIYRFYQETGFHYQQYIVCLDPVGEEPGQRPWSLSPSDYGSFLIKLFDLWYQDCLLGRAPYIRQFENYLDLLLGIPPESCEQRGSCGLQTVIEADGSVYPCDFYASDAYCLGNLTQSSLEGIPPESCEQRGSCGLQTVIEADGSVYPCDFYASDAYCLGNLTQSSLEALRQTRRQKDFLERSLPVPDVCKNCPFYALCRNGCFRHRLPSSGVNYFCEGYQSFFSHALPFMQELARKAVNSRDFR